VHVTTVLAASSSAFDQPGTLGFLVVFGMGVVLFFVFRSMAKHLRKVNTAARLEEEAQQKAEAQHADSGGVAANSSPNGRDPR
jgi:hypothetical protein